LQISADTEPALIALSAETVDVDWDRMGRRRRSKGRSDTQLANADMLT